MKKIFRVYLFLMNHSCYQQMLVYLSTSGASGHVETYFTAFWHFIRWTSDVQKIIVKCFDDKTIVLCRTAVVLGGLWCWISVPQNKEHQPAAGQGSASLVLNLNISHITWLNLFTVSISLGNLTQLGPFSPGQIYHLSSDLTWSQTLLLSISFLKLFRSRI